MTTAVAPTAVTTAAGSGVRQEAWRAGLAGIALAAVMKLPVLTHLRGAVPEDLGDPLLQAWQLAWGPHALLHHPLSVWSANIFWPLPNSLAFSDSLLGWAPLGALFGSGPAAAVLRYNVIFLLAYALAFTGAYALARQLGAGRGAAAVAGVGYAYAPWHLAQDGHLQILSNGGIPLALALLARGHGYGRSERPDRPRPGVVLAGWGVAAWQVSLGFGLGLAFSYLLATLALVYAVSYVVRRRRAAATATPSVPRRLVAAELAGLTLFLAVGLAFAAPYLRVAADHPEARRTVADLTLYSPPLSGFLVAPADSDVWGRLQAGARDRLAFPPEMTLAPGGVLVLLAAYGVIRGAWSRGRRWGLAAGATVTLVLGLGVTLAGGRYTYLPLFEHAPGWQGIRTPGRLVVLLTLALALLAAAGVDAIVADIAARYGRRRRRAVMSPGVRRGVVVAAFVLVAVEGHGVVPTPPVPMLPAALDSPATTPVYVLPSDSFADDAAMLFSTAGFYPLVNGSSGFLPAELAALQAATESFPDAGSVALLRDRGVRRVVLRVDAAVNTPWADAADRPVGGLPLSRRDVGADVVYDLDPVAGR